MPKPPRDISQFGHYIVSKVTKVTEKPPSGVREGAKINAAASKGGLRGSKARADKLTPEERKAIASKAAKKRWAKK